MNVLITGGAGFIGLNLTRSLLKSGYNLTLLDNFSPQIHNGQTELPDDIRPHVKLIRGDIRDKDSVVRATENQQIIIHLAAETGTGQSMYAVHQYESVNVGGTAVLFDALINNPSHKVEKIILASSRAVYGEGRYQCSTHDIVYPSSRVNTDLSIGLFQPRCPFCQTFCTSLPTMETNPYQPVSFYGLTKQHQEETMKFFAKTMGIQVVALRYQNVYGPGQSLQNPYTGILAIFTNLAIENKPISVFEDGKPSRDFVYVEDVVKATKRCISQKISGSTFLQLNVGSGINTTIHQVATSICQLLGSRSAITVTEQYRIGDIRHNVADLTKIKSLLGYEPTWNFDSGLEKFLTWSQQQPIGNNSLGAVYNELYHRQLANQARTINTTKE